MTTLTPAGRRVLDAASELFYTHGIHAVGVEAIADHAGTTKKTLYDRFGSKDALVAAYLDRRSVRWKAHVEAWLAQHPTQTARHAPLGLLDALAAWMVGQDRGCAFVNAFAEVGGTDHPGLAVIRAEKDWLRSRYTELCSQAGLPQPERLGSALHLLHEGALVAGTAGGDPDALARAREVAEQLLDQAARRG